MPHLTLGHHPETLLLVLVSDADFVTTLTNSDGDWSPTAQIELRIGDDIVWPATIADDVATFDVDKVAVNQAIASDNDRVRLFYVDGTADLCWAKGKVTRG